MNARTLFPFAGGIRLPSCKESTQDKHSLELAIPDRLVLPLRQHVGVPARPCVAVGDAVLKGDLIAASEQYVGMRLHAPTSGRVSAIAEFPVIHPSGLPATAIELQCDAQDRTRHAASFEAADAVDPALVCERIAEAGIVGLGGAGFPAHVKVRESIGQPIDLLIINGVECEPYITCDDRIIREHPAAIIDGARLLAGLLQAQSCVIALKDDMPDARAALEANARTGIEIVSVPAIYPAGGEKQLITLLTGREVPSGLLPFHVGVAMLNVHTLFAVYEAVTARKPLIERMVTVAGAVARPGNYKVRLGTPVSEVLAQVGGASIANPRLISGGPMMGTEILNASAAITKTVNCILVLAPHSEAGAATACIRCGECVPVCPVGLQPQQLFEVTRIADLDAAQDLHLFDCIECGCCAYVCPSRIPLVHFYRSAKSSIEAIDRDRADADKARMYFNAQEQRRASHTNVADAGGIELVDIDGIGARELRDDIAAAVARSRARHADASDD